MLHAIHIALVGLLSATMALGMRISHLVDDSDVRKMPIVRLHSQVSLSGQANEALSPSKNIEQEKSDEPDRLKMAGGVSSTKEADKEVIGLVEALKPEIGNQLGIELTELIVVSYTTQVVAGIKFFVKVKYNGERYADLIIFQPLPHVGDVPKLISVRVTVQSSRDDAERRGLLGGMSLKKKGDEEVRDIVAALRTEIGNQVGEELAELTVVSYTTQVVAGTKFFIKVKYNGEHYADLTIFRPLPHAGDALQLTSAKVIDQRSEGEPERRRLHGGESLQKEADEEVRDIVAALRTEIGKQLGEELAELTVVSYTTQIVAGTYFYVKVKYDGEHYADLTIFRPLPYTGMPVKLDWVKPVHWSA